MHIPDGFLDTKVAVATGVLAAAGLGVALHHARKYLPPRRIPLLGLAAAFVFAAQMLNFPVAGGTSGHMIGGVLTAVLLGPSAAVIVLSAVLIVQCLMFADGGMSALGANIFNMGMVSGVLCWAIYYAVSRAIKGLFGCVLAAAFAAWCGTVLASIACAGELAASGTVAWSVVLPAMVGVHMLIGIGEGVITALVVVAIARSRPELLQPDVSAASPTAPKPYGTILGFGILIAFGLALFASPWACSWPDGLDWVAENKQFVDKEAENTILSSPLSDYKMPGIGWEPLATSLAGAAGTAVVFFLAWLLARALVPRPKPEAEIAESGKK